MEDLQQQLDALIERLDDPKRFRARLEELVSVYPFNSYEYIISHLLAAGKLSIDEYYELRNNYVERNIYLYLFEISAPSRSAPRGALVNYGHRGISSNWCPAWRGPARSSILRMQVNMTSICPQVFVSKSKLRERWNLEATNRSMSKHSLHTQASPST